jgi:hypothetical protein
MNLALAVADVIGCVAVPIAATSHEPLKNAVIFNYPLPLGRVVFLFLLEIILPDALEVSGGL